MSEITAEGWGDVRRYAEHYRAKAKNPNTLNLASFLVQAIDALAAAERELAGVRKFAGDILQEADDASDVGGDVVQERALACGLLRSETRTEPCDSEDCACSEYGFPITCYRYTELGLACIRAANHALPEVDDATK